MNLNRRWQRLARTWMLGLAVAGVHLWLLWPPGTDTATPPGDLSNAPEDSSLKPAESRAATVRLSHSNNSRPTSATTPEAPAEVVLSATVPDIPAAGGNPHPATGSATSPARLPAARHPRHAASSSPTPDHPPGPETPGADPAGEPQPATMAETSLPVPDSGTAFAALSRPSPGRTAAAPGCPAVPQDKLPPSVNVRYSLDRGGIHGEGQLEWRRLNDRYKLRLDGRLPLMGTILSQRSEGGFDHCGLAPRRHSERRLGRSERALSFERQGEADSNGGNIEQDRVRFSSRSQSLTLRPGTQDRLSWLVEVAGRLSAWPAPGPETGERLGLDVAAVGGDIQHWTFVVQGRNKDGHVHLSRVPDEPFDTRADVWTDPQRGHWPVRVELREASGDPLVLKLTGWQPIGP